MKMKKYGIILLVVLALTVAIITIPAFAANGDVVYVKDGGTGDGSSADNAMGDLFEAIDKLDEGGTVVVCGDITLSPTTTNVAYAWTANTGKVTVTGKYNGQDYGPTVSFTSGKVIIDCASEIEFDNIHFKYVGGNSMEFWSGPSLTMGHNVTYSNNGSTIEAAKNGVICFRMGNYNASCEASNLEILSGTVSYIQAGNNKADYTVGSSTITLHPGVTVTDFIQCGGTASGKTGNSTINIDGADVGYIYVGGYGSGNNNITGNLELNIKNTQITALYGQRLTTDLHQAGGAGTISGDLNLTLDNVTVGTWNIADMTVNGQQNLTVKNATDMKVTDTLAGWDSLTLANSTLWVDAAYAGPTTFTADSDSLLIVDDATTTMPDGALLESAAVVTVDGTTVADLSAAYTALSEKGGIIRLATDITLTLNAGTEFYAWPGYVYTGTKTGPVTITSADPADPAVLTFVTSRATRSVFSFRQVTKFSNMELRVHQNSTGGVQLFTGPSLTFGEGMLCTTNDGAAIVNNDILGVRLGDHNTAYADIDSKFTMYSGTVNFIHGGNNRTNVDDVEIYVGKNATVVQQLQCGGTGMAVASATVTIDGATVNALQINGYGSAATMGTVTLTVRNATVGSIVYHRTSDAAAICTTANITLDNSTVGSFDAKDSRITTGNLTLKNYDYISMAAGLSGWDSLTLNNAIVFVEGSEYAGPASVTADADSAILVDSSIYTELPTIEGVNVAFCDLTHIHSMTYTAAKAPGAFTAGNTEYYYCSGCGNYYADADGETQIYYDIDIYLAPTGQLPTHHDYTDGNNFSLETILSSGGSQGVAVCGDLLFKASNSGTCTVINLLTGERVGSFDFGSVSRDENGTAYSGGATANHANSIMFSSIKFDENDPFPLLFVCAGNAGDHIVKSEGLDGTDLWGEDTEGSYYGHLAIERIFYDEATGTYSSETIQRVFFNDMANLVIADGDNYQTNLLSTMRDSETGALYYASGNDYDASAGYQKIGWGWPAWFVDSDPTSDTYGKLFIFSVRYRTYSSYESTTRNFYNLGSDWNYFLEDGTGNAYIITELDMPALPTSEEDPNYGGNTILYPKDIKDQFTTLYTNGATQGGTMYQGRIYYSYGFGEAATNAHHRNYINVIDINKRDIVAEVPLCNDPTTGSYEPECPAIWRGELIISMNPGVYSLGYIALDEYTVKDGVTYIECSLCGHNLKTIHTTNPSMGDTNCDGYVTEADVELIKKYRAGLVDETALNLTVCDVDDNKQVDVYDAYLIQLFIAEQIDTFPCES